MSDASEVLSAIYESLSMVGEGQKLVKELFEWQVVPPPPPPTFCALRLRPSDSLALSMAA
jgi:hypothetical protein